ncbi:MAG: aryl sulfotransferase [Actinomycetota bacterium]|jgi:aryl sulfotransferase|nr:aryl sulfotransferase [Actinomycetota bacterium]
MPGSSPEHIHEYRNHHLDSTRWERFNAREGDIVVTTAYKAGTTWTQRMLAALVLELEPGVGSLMEVSPWIDARFHGPIEPILESLDAQTHRRFVKSHLAADGIRFFPEAKYVVVGRDTRDVFMSLWNHYSAYTDLAYSLFNDPERPGPEFPRCPEQPRDLWPRWISEGWFEWEPDGWPFWSHHHHLSTWWQWRELSNVHFMHFGDMLADTEGEMRRLAAYCEIDVPDEQWPAIVDAVQLDAMRKETKGGDEVEDPAAMIFEGGVDRFLFKGTNGRWRDVLTPDDLELYQKAVAALDPGLHAWLEGGRLASA